MKTLGPYCTMPAQFGGYYIRGFDGTNVARVGLDINHGERVIEDNARFIVRACNSHADLLAALEYALLVLNARGGSLATERAEASAKARAAIAKAKEAQ